jgi:plastocyanin
MRRALAVLTIAILGLPLLASPAGAGECLGSIEITDAGYTPETETASMPSFGGPLICWTNNGTTAHTATSNKGFFDTGQIMAKGFQGEVLPGAGRYGYHCDLHPGQHSGVVKIRPLASATTATVGDEITLYIGTGEFKGYNWDLQRKIGDGQWVTIRSAGGSQVVVRPSRTGTFWYRARTRNFVADEVTGWSPARKVIVTAA